jgi:hypothetical protein
MNDDLCFLENMHAFEQLTQTMQVLQGKWIKTQLDLYR